MTEPPAVLAQTLGPASRGERRTPRAYAAPGRTPLELAGTALARACRRSDHRDARTPRPRTRVRPRSRRLHRRRYRAAAVSLQQWCEPWSLGYFPTRA